MNETALNLAWDVQEKTNPDSANTMTFSNIIIIDIEKKRLITN